MMSKFSDLSKIILKCMELNLEKLKRFYPSLNSSAAILEIKIESSICQCVMLLASAEKFYFAPPEDLINRLLKLINNTKWELSPEDRILYLKSEVNEAILELQEIKGSMKSKTLQDVEEYLIEIMEEEI